MSNRQWKQLGLAVLFGALLALTAQSVAETQDSGIFPVVDVEAPRSHA